jgi:hypothetical protein
MEDEESIELRVVHSKNRILGGGSHTARASSTTSAGPIIIDGGETLRTLEQEEVPLRTLGRKMGRGIAGIIAIILLSVIAATPTVWAHGSRRD